MILVSSVVQCSSLFIFLSYLRLSFESFALPARAGDAFMAVELTSLATVYFGLLRSQLSSQLRFLCPSDWLSVRLFVRLSVRLCVRLSVAVSVQMQVIRILVRCFQLCHLCSSVCVIMVAAFRLPSAFLYFSLSLCCRFLSFFRFLLTFTVAAHTSFSFVIQDVSQLGEPKLN